MIPKILHQLWIGPKPVPIDFINTWKEKYRDWEYVLWNEELIKQKFPNGFKNQVQYDIMPELNGKCDIARYEILNKYGGFFVDADEICVHKIDDYLLDNEMFASYENEIVRPGLVATGCMGASPDNTLLIHIINTISKKSGKSLWDGFPSAWKTVGPVLLTIAIHELKYNNISIYPSYYFIPRHYTGIEYTGPAKIYAKHYWGSTVNSEFDYTNVKDLKH